MKDIIITSKRLKKELYILLGCSIAAFAINILAIIIYKTSWVEAFSQIGYVLVIAVFLYVLIAVLRFIFKVIRKAFRRIKKKIK